MERLTFHQPFFAQLTDSCTLRSTFSAPDVCFRIDVLATGEYVNMTMLDRRVAQIYVSTDRRTQGNTYNSYVAVLGTTYGTPDRLETKYYRNGIETGSSGEHLRWLNGDQYMEGSEIERTITIGSQALDVEIAKQEARL